MFNPSFYKDKVVLVTGHTGFKGSWLCKMLVNFGAKVVGYALPPEQDENLFKLSKVCKDIVNVEGDIRDYQKLKATFDKYQPEIVIHMAAQPIVRISYEDPRYTFETNVMGTVNVMECIRTTPSVKSAINVTTDKVYANSDNMDHAFKEEEPLDGYDPYSNSKSCSELVTHSYKKSFFANMDVAVSTARAGNVIGGGDFQKDRIIPDCFRAIVSGQKIIIRNPDSIRPYQHVLEPLAMYLTIIEKQYKDHSLADYYNVGPDESDCKNTLALVKMLKEKCPRFDYEIKSDNGPHEAKFLKLDCSKIKDKLGFKPRWNIETTISKIADWTEVYLRNKDDIPAEMDKEIEEFLNI